jgi:hypothetical protein
MPVCSTCAAPLAKGVHTCKVCGSEQPASTTALVNAPAALPRRRLPSVTLPRLVPTLPADSGTRLAVGALLPALAGLLAREGMRYLLERRKRETRLLRFRGTVVRQVNGHAESFFFDTEVLGRPGKR